MHSNSICTWCCWYDKIVYNSSHIALFSYSYTNFRTKGVHAIGDRLTATGFLNEKATNSKIKECYLNRALEAAVKNDDHVSVGKLVLHGSTNISECLRYAKDARKPRARAMLLLIKAAQTGDVAIVQKVFGEHEAAPGLKHPQDYEDDGFRDVQEVALSLDNLTRVPMEIARCKQYYHSMREQLLFRTDVNMEEGYVYWHGLQLLQIEISWLRKIAWVKKLRLARNGLKSLPPEIGTFLKQVGTK